ncbi:DUF2332 domain-containing protein [Nocardioides rotundus]|uniref:DUF2332 domain-containing protein n=1 Tax=Nocardioides rotundus TaxID=1774216 RepID=UPI001CC18861|nr:DUF2332 domain-containing protein [Nocardioides rotundus]UAL31873.1 DUF2332 domain-containing protein [Nocardioides rotundus]
MDLGLAERYLDFAEFARLDSPSFAAWAEGVAHDPEVQGWLADLPAIKQQPNLVFAAARWHGAETPAAYDELRRVLFGQEDAVKATIRERATQTNEVGRLATLVPAFAAVPGPLALIEVGASAGLTLFPDRYDYSWPPLGELVGSGGPRLTARAEGPVPIPAAHPEVAWRGGCDLNPLDVTDDDAMAWLRTLVWPEQADRLARLEAAVEVARREPPYIVRGDLLAELPGLLAEAGRHGTPVVFHSAVIAYLESDQRDEFAATMGDLVAAGECRWVSNEAPSVLPGVASTVPAERLVGRFVLGLDGRAVGWTHGHGHALGWL